MIDECTHDPKMPKPSMCVECMFEGPVAEPERWSRVGRPFNAQLVGACPGHDHGVLDGIAVGERIQRWDRGDRTTYLHDGCRP